MRHRRRAEEALVAAPAQLIVADGHDARASPWEGYRVQLLELIRFRVEFLDRFQIIRAVEAADDDDRVAENGDADRVPSHVEVGDESPGVGDRIVFLYRRRSLARWVRHRQVVSAENEQAAVVGRNGDSAASFVHRRLHHPAVRVRAVHFHRPVADRRLAAANDVQFVVENGNAGRRAHRLHRRDVTPALRRQIQPLDGVQIAPSIVSTLRRNLSQKILKKRFQVVAYQLRTVRL